LTVVSPFSALAFIFMLLLAMG